MSPHKNEGIINTGTIGGNASVSRRVIKEARVSTSSLAAQSGSVSGSSEGISQQPHTADVASRSVFVVHGRDEAMTHGVARVLKQLDLEPIVLREQADSGRTVIEKFEAYTSVPYAIVLLSGDDVGCLASAAPSDLRPRARQNVIFELGFFCGMLGRRRVCILHTEGLELPSDITGVLYVPFDDAGAWRFVTAREIAAAGIHIDANLLI